VYEKKKKTIETKISAYMYHHLYNMTAINVKVNVSRSSNLKYIHAGKQIALTA